MAEVLAYDCDGNCLVETDCNGVCGGSSELDECGVCDGGVAHVIVEVIF